MAVAIRSTDELKLMRESGRITAVALKKAIEAAKEGTTLKQLDQVAEAAIGQLGAGSAFKTVSGYYWTSCVTINDEVVHGIPREIKIKAGDIVSVDLGALYNGWYTDAAWTVLVGSAKDYPKQARFLQFGQEALWKAVAQAKSGNKLGDISFAIQQQIESGGFNVVRALIGHGVGKKLHEEPEIPGVGKPGTGLLLKTGMTLAIEVIYTEGGYEVYQRDDGWTIATEDGSLAGLFEMTVVVGDSRAEVLTDWRRVK